MTEGAGGHAVRIPLGWRLEYWLVAAAFRLLRRLGPVGASNLGGFVARTVGPLLPVTRVGDANLRRATEAIREQQAAQSVQTDVSGGAEASQVGNYTLPTPGTAFAYTLGITLAYPLDLSGQIRRGIEAARERLRGIAQETPMERSRYLSGMLGAEVFLKCENLQRTGSFKFRGAYTRLHRLPPERRAAGVVAASL